MNTNELFELIQDDLLPDELNGEFLLYENIIIWSYNLTDDSEEIDYYDDEENEMLNFEAQSSEELLLEAYQEDIEKLTLFLDGIGETDCWSITNSEILDDTIVFKILK